MEQLTYEQEDAWLREVQLGKRKDLPDGRSVDEAREAIHNPASEDVKEDQAEKQTIEGLVKNNGKDELLEMAKNAHLTQLTEKNTKQEIAQTIIENAEKVSEVE